MVERPRVLIAGGSGVFGRLLACELLRTTTADLILAGRSVDALHAAREELGSTGRTSTITLDLKDPTSLTRAARGCIAVACAAGPFQGLPPGLPMAAVQAGAHWVDIGDYEGWVLPLLDGATLDAAARKAGTAVIPGLSTVPALSGALARWGKERLPGAVEARVTLFVGNRNAKGPGTIASALSSGFRRPTPVELPPPMGRRMAYLARSPDPELFRRELALATEFSVVLGWRVTGRFLWGARGLSSRLGERSRSQLAHILSSISAPFGWFGSRGGGIQVDLWDGTRRVSVAAVTSDQRLAILPCAMALERLVNDQLPERGVVHPSGWLSPTSWVAEILRREVRIFTHVGEGYS